MQKSTSVNSYSRIRALRTDNTCRVSADNVKASTHNTTLEAEIEQRVNRFIFPVKTF